MEMSLVSLLFRQTISAYNTSSRKILYLPLASILVMNDEPNIQIFSLRVGYMNEPLQRQRNGGLTMNLEQKRLYEYIGVVMAMF